MAHKQRLLQAQQALQAGQRPQAARLLKEGLRQNPRDHRIWLMLARVAPSTQAQAQCIRRAAALAPQDPIVQKALRWLERNQSPAAAPSPSQPGQPTPQHHNDTLARLRAKSQAQPLPQTDEPANSFKRGWLWGGTAALFIIAVLLVGLLIRYGGAGQQPAAHTETTELALASGTAGQQPEDDDAAAASVTNENQAVVTATATPLPPTVTSTPTQSPLLPKSIAAKNDTTQTEPRPTWTLTPTPTNTPTPAPTLPPTRIFDGGELSRPLVGPNEKWIDINLTDQVLRAYEGQTLVFETLISSGLPQYSTVTGQFRIYYRLESQTMDGRRLGFDYVTENVPYVQYFYGDFALHGAYWHNNFGQQMSHGCVNLSVPDSQWLYEWAGMGTLVNVHY